MPHQHRYAARLIWTGAERGPTRDYGSYSRSYRVEVEGKPPLDGSPIRRFAAMRAGTIPRTCSWPRSRRATC
jgi:hypothetical protein